MAVPASFNDIAADAAVRDYFGDVWYQTVVRVPRGWDGRADRAALRVGHAPGDGVGRRREVVIARGRLHPVRGRRHRARRRRASEVRITVRGQQHADLPDHPAGCHRGHPGRASGSATGTTSSTTPACTARSGCTPPLRRHIDDVTVVTGLDGGTGTVEYRVEPTAPTGSRSSVVLARRRRRRGRHRHRRGGHPDRAGRAPVGARATATSTTSRCSWSTRRAPWSTATTRASACAPSRCDGIRFLINGEPFYFTGFGKHEDIRGDRQGPQRRLPGARLRAAGLDRRQLVPDLALPLLRGRPRLRRPAGHRAHRRDRRGRPEHGPGRRHLRRAGLHDVLPRDRSTTRPGRCTRRRSAS